MNKHIILFACGIVVGTAAQAGVQDYVVSPATLVDWQIVGADRGKLQGQDTLSLPAGAELTRSFTGGAVLLYSVSSPDFGSASSDWPVLQVGPVALAFVRHGDKGQVALLAGDVVSYLSPIVPLDASGRSARSLEVVLGIDPSTNMGVVALADQTVAFKIITQRSAVEVAVASGESRAWAHDTLEVMLIDADDAANASKDAANSESGKKSALLEAAAQKLKQAVGIIGGNEGAGEAGDNVPKKLPGGSSTLEISTPAAVRHHAAAVRAAIAQVQQK